MIPIFSSAYEIKLDSILDNILYVAVKSDMPYNYYSLFYRLSYRKIQWSIPSTPQAISPYFK